MIAIIGAGLSGSMTALMLSRLGYEVHVFEKRLDSVSDDPSSSSSCAFGASRSAVRRSINLALSHRGMAALETVGLLEAALSISIRMPGRVIHRVTFGHILPTSCRNVRTRDKEADKFGSSMDAMIRLSTASADR
jgi:2-polyprenyl-6-methoxyphenol hydroxylase-like FAD-dependent oxidoreductase